MLIVSDSSPVIALAICDKLELLNKLFDQVYVPQAVFNELAIPHKPNAEKIIEWARDKVITVKDTTVVKALSSNLDPGESEALSLYWETSADFLLIDEKRGRNVALRNGVKIIGTVGILFAAKQRGLITFIKPFLDILIYNGFRISNIHYHQYLERAGE
jgi:predicted nucleic acid-binding protein